MPLRGSVKASTGFANRGSDIRTGRDGAYGADWIEAEDDARLSQVIGLATDGRRVFVLLLGLVGGDMVLTCVTGMGLDMEETEALGLW